MPRQPKHGINDHEVGPKIKGRATIPVGPSLTPAQARAAVGAMIEQGLVSFGPHPKTSLQTTPKHPIRRTK